MWRIHRFICIHFRTKSGLFSLAHHPLQAVSMSLASLDCILNGWTCTMRVQRKFETRDCEIYVHSFVWLSLVELFICYTFLCYALVCFCARTFNYRFILLNIATQKATATFCTVSVFWTLVSDQRYVSFWRIAFDPREKSFDFIIPPNMNLNCPFLHAYCLSWKSDDDDDDDEDQWTMPPSVSFIFQFSSQVDHCTCDVHKTDEAFPFRRKKSPEGISYVHSTYFLRPLKYRQKESKKKFLLLSTWKFSV